jgi:hypothetical protein
MLAGKVYDRRTDVQAAYSFRLADGLLDRIGNRLGTGHYSAPETARIDLADSDDL